MRKLRMLSQQLSQLPVQAELSSALLGVPLMTKACANGGSTFYRIRILEILYSSHCNQRSPGSKLEIFLSSILLFSYNYRLVKWSASIRVIYYVELTIWAFDTAYAAIFFVPPWFCVVFVSIFLLMQLYILFCHDFE